MKAVCKVWFVAVLWGLMVPADPAWAQGTAFTYQGRLVRDGVPANGPHDFRFAVYDADSAGSQVGGTLTNLAVAVTNGLFVTELDFGAGVFTGPARWLEIAARTNGGGAFTVLSPRQKLTATPYAITASNLTGTLPATQLTGTLPSAQLSGTYSGALIFDNAGNSYSGSGAGLTNLNASQLLSGKVPAEALGNAWRTVGNAGTTPGTHFVGTTDNQPLEIRVNNARALRLEPHGISPNVIGGHSGNVVGSGAYGATLGGGGADVAPNSIHANFATLGGGAGNTIQTNASFATLGGGIWNTIQATAYYATLGGGIANTIQTNASFATLGGGQQNTIQVDAQYSTLDGGRENTIQTNAWYSTLGGGYQNTIQAGATNATISGGWSNTVQAYASHATIGGGQQNTIEAYSDSATLGGGIWNTIQANAYYATLGGGAGNTIQTTALSATLGGGYQNAIQANAWYATLGGGAGNTIQTAAFYATLGGGYQNTIQADSFDATLGGGIWNTIQAYARYATLGGGSGNTIQTAALSATLGGGEQNTIQAFSFNATLGGGYQNTIQTNSFYATLGGGYQNTIQTNAYYATLGGGRDNTILPNANYATIPGGRLNSATDYAFAAGRRAKALNTGSFVWGDSTDSDVTSTNANSVTFRASGGVRFFSNTNMTLGVMLAPNATAWSALSDRNAKENFAPINPREILEKVAGLPLTSWNYKDDPERRRYIGPVAQDFHAAFGLGTDTSINPLDIDGVTLAAIQGLHEQLKKKDAQIAALEERLAALEQRLAAQNGGGR